LDCKNGKWLFQGEAPPKLIGNIDHEGPGRVPGHSLEFLREMGLVIVVVVKLFLKEVVRQPSGPFLVEVLKSEDPCQSLRRETDMLFKEEI
jgi:hypothetical protein